MTTEFTALSLYDTETVLAFMEWLKHSKFSTRDSAMIVIMAKRSMVVRADMDEHDRFLNIMANDLWLDFVMYESL